MRTITRYPTKPLECWAKAKELRRMRNRHVWTAQEKGEVVIQGLLLEGMPSLFAGLGDFADPSFGPHYNQLMKNHPELIRCMEVAEARGYGRDMCSSMRLHLGQLLMGLATTGPRGGSAVPHIAFQAAVCRSMVKTGQLYAEHFGVPFMTIDIPYKKTKEHRDYMFHQLQEAIPWMEQATGRKVDDEKLIAAIRNEWEVNVLWAKICELNKAVPAPLDYRLILSMQIPRATLRHKKEAVQFYRELYDEVQERVAQGISARGFEQARLTQEGIAPFPYIHILRYPEKFGAIIVAGHMFNAGAWELEEDGTWRSAPSLSELEKELRTRDDALLALADLYIFYHFHECSPLEKPASYLGRIRDWKVAGAIVHLDRGCINVQNGMQEAVFALHLAGIPTVTFEGSQADPRDLSEPQVYDRLDSFFESLGLTRLEQAQPETGDTEALD